MIINGADLISRSTQTSSRTLLIASAALIFVERYNLEPVNWPLLKSDLPIEAYQIAGLGIILFSMVSLLVHWVGDHISYMKWFKSNNFGKGSTYSDFRANLADEPIPAIQKRLGWLSDAVGMYDQNLSVKTFDFPVDAKEIEKLIGSLERTDRKLTELKVQVDGLNQILETLDARFLAVLSWSRLTIYVWYLALPIGLGLVALFRIYCSMQE